MAAGERRDILWRFLGDTRDLSNSTKTAETTLGKVGKTASRIGTAIKTGFAVAASSALVRVGGDLLDHGAKLDAIDSRTDQVFGDGANTIRDWADDVAKSFGLSQAGVLDLASELGDLLVPLGFTRDEVTAMTPEILEAANAFSYWTGGTVSVEDAASRVQKALLGEREGLKELGLSISEADVSAQMLADGTSDLTGELEKQAKAQATLTLITEGGADALDAYAAGGSEALEAQNSLDSALAEMKDTVARELTPALTTLAEVGASSVIPMLGDLAGAMASGAGLAEQFGNRLNGIWADDSRLAAELHDALGDVNDRLENGSDKLDAYAAGMALLAQNDATDAIDEFAGELGLTKTQLQLVADNAVTLTNRLDDNGAATESLMAFTTDYNDATNRVIVAQGEQIDETDRLIARYKPLTEAVDDTNEELDEQITLLDELEETGKQLTALETLHDAQVDLKDAQETYNGLIEDGTTSGDEYTEAMFNLAAAGNAVAVATEAARAQGGLYVDDLVEIAKQAGLAGDAVWDLVRALLEAGGQSSGTGGNPTAPPKALAAGTLSARPGATLVGEQGPELVTMSGGERVYNAGDTRRMLAGGGGAGTVINLNVQAGISSPVDTARAIVSALQSYERTSGPLPLRIR